MQSYDNHGNYKLTVLQVFFFLYSILEVPANVMLKLLRPSLWIGYLVIVWGTVCPESIPNTSRVI
jgi:hypothetical protein